MAAPSKDEFIARWRYRTMALALAQLGKSATELEKLARGVDLHLEDIFYEFHPRPTPPPRGEPTIPEQWEIMLSYEPNLNRLNREFIKFLGLKEEDKNAIKPGLWKYAQSQGWEFNAKVNKFEVPKKESK